MKRLLLITMALCGVASASSQNIARTGVYCAADGETVVGVPKSTVAVELRIAERSFTPGCMPVTHRNISACVRR